MHFIERTKTKLNEDDLEDQSDLARISFSVVLI